MEIENIKLGNRKPPLPNKKNKPEGNQVAVLKQNKASRNSNHIRFPPIHLPKFVSMKKIEDREPSIERMKSQSRERVPTNGSLKSLPRSIKSSSSCRSSNNSSQRILSRQKLFAPNISARSWIAYQMNQGKVIYGKRINKKREMASLTKIMNLITAIQVFETLKLNPQNIVVRVSKQAASINGTTAFLRVGMQLTLYDLMFGIMLPSGNDAAYCMAQVLGSILLEKDTIKSSIIHNVDSLYNYYQKKNKSVMRYLQEMNSIAQRIQMYQSRYTNPHGLSQLTNVSTAQDLAKLCSYATKNKLFQTVVNTKEYKLNYKLKKQQQETDIQVQETQQKQHRITWTNTNKMLWQGWDGVKTGVTPNAGPCLAASTRRTSGQKEFNILVILLCSKSMQIRWKQVQQIANWVVTENLL